MKMTSPRRRWALVLTLTLPLTMGVAVGEANAAVGERSAGVATVTESCPDTAGANAGADVKRASAAAASFKVWLAGDSTMANASKCPVGWGSQFDALFNSSVTVVNNAVGGRSIQTWLYEGNVTGEMKPPNGGECVLRSAGYSSRWKAMLDPNTGMKSGDYLFIQFGINDGHPACPRHVGPARYKELLGLMAKAAKDRGVRLVFLTPVSAIRCEGNKAVGSRGFLEETRDAAAAAKVSVIDLHALSVTLYNRLKFCPNDKDYSKGAVGAFFCNDHTHFETAGARRIAGVVAQAMRDQGFHLATYLK